MSKGIKYFDLARDTYRGLTSLGTIKCPDAQVFKTLEDCVRGWGIKDAKNTAIPVTTGDGYLMKVTMSSRFKRRMVMVYTESDGFTLKANGISFKGIRIHGGNTHLDVWGCIAAAKKRLTDTTIQGSVEDIITAMVEKFEKEGYECRLRVTNKPQSE